MAKARAWAPTLLAVAPIAVAMIGKIPDASAKPAPAPVVIVNQQAVAPAAPAAPLAAVPAPVAMVGPVSPAAANAPAPSAACLARYSLIGLPIQRGDDQAARQRIKCMDGYALGFDSETHDPDWVIERLSADKLVGKASRGNAFLFDPSLPGSADLSDYDKSGYDRGHQAPAGDAKYDQKVMDQSFFLTNMAPQVGIGFNRGAWKYLEETVRAWILCGGHKELYVITGPVYTGSKLAPIGHDKVAVPAQFYKIVYDPASGHALGFLLPNTKIGSTIDLQKYVVPIADIETETGLNFFAAFDRRDQAMLETAAGTAWGHASTCSGG